MARWAHGPSHLFASGHAYIITAGTYEKTCFFKTPERRTMLLETLKQQAQRLGWSLEAWAVLSDHYHVVAHAPRDGATLKNLVRSVHSITAREVNNMDQTPGRKVWHQYWDTCITHERSYLARLNYVHGNPVKHGVVKVAEEYPWCSMAWFLREARSSYVNTVLETKCNGISIHDDF